MFKSPFSFTGRIRRLELGLTYVFYFLFLGLASVLFEINDFFDSIIVVSYLISYWLIIAQGAKRCHDLGNSGFYQLIPFYIFVMFLNEGSNQENKYGIDPKSKAYLETKRKIFDFKIRKLSKHSLLEIIVMCLLSALVLSFNNILFEGHENYINLSYFIMPIPCFLILLFMGKSIKNQSNNKPYRITQQIYFSIIYYIIVRIYTVNVRNADFNLDTISFELIAISLIFGITFISVGLFHLFTGPRIKHA